MIDGITADTHQKQIQRVTEMEQPKEEIYHGTHTDDASRKPIGENEQTKEENHRGQ